MKIVAIATATALSLVAPTFAQQQSGTGGGAAGERGSAAQTDRNSGASPANPTPPPATEASPGSGSMNTGGSAAPLAQDKAGKEQSPGASSSPRN